MPQPRSDDDRLAAELAAMRGAITATKRDLAELQRAPAGSGSIQRAACELDAVSAAQEAAATAILGAVEEIELSANLIRATAPEGGSGPADAILERVVVLYEACNFQDVTGQRIRKVVGTLQFVEERLDRMIALWNPAVAPASGSPAGTLLAGPSLPGEAGHVSQSDIDAYFA